MDERGLEHEGRPRPLDRLAAGTLRLLLAAAREDAAARRLWPAGEALTGLVGHVLRDRGVAALVEAALTAAFAGEAAAFTAARPYDLAIAWPERLASGDKRRAAALLWAAARRPEPVFRVLEARFVEDLEVAAAKVLMAARVYASEPCRAAMRPRKPAGTDSWRRGSSSGRTRSSGAMSQGGSGTSSSS